MCTIQIWKAQPQRYIILLYPQPITICQMKMFSDYESIIKNTMSYEFNNWKSTFGLITLPRHFGDTSSTGGGRFRVYVLHKHEIATRHFVFYCFSADKAILIPVSHLRGKMSLNDCYTDWLVTWVVQIYGMTRCIINSSGSNQNVTGVDRLPYPYDKISKDWPPSYSNHHSIIIINFTLYQINCSTIYFGSDHFI